MDSRGMLWTENGVLCGVRFPGSDLPAFGSDGHGRAWQASAVYATA